MLTDNNTALSVIHIVPCILTAEQAAQPVNYIVPSILIDNYADGLLLYQLITQPSLLLTLFRGL